ncbi:integrase core domain-containing protein [Gordonia otitidis]|uniref:integrase core domain-containing protein n=1 Tax=Gordonia sp. w5E2 TaxID=3075837 RepID=UPI001D1535CC|nr:integrase core domain-containing protein [Gordonia otitidis]
MSHGPTNTGSESHNPSLRETQGASCLNRNCWPTLLEARVVIADFKDDHNHRHRHSALGYQTPAEYSAGCTHRHHPVGCEID